MESFVRSELRASLSADLTVKFFFFPSLPTSLRSRHFFLQPTEACRLRVECRDLVGGRRGPLANETYNKINQYLPRAVAEQRAREGLIGGQMPGRDGSPARRGAASSHQHANAATGSIAAAATTTTTTITETTNLRWIGDTPAPAPRNADETAREAERKKREKESDERRRERGKKKAEREEREEFEKERRKFEKEKEEWEREKSGARRREERGRERERRSRSPRRRDESVSSRLPQFFQRCLSKADDLRETSADLLEYVAHSTKAYSLKKKLANEGQLPGSSKKIDRRSNHQSSSRQQPAGQNLPSHPPPMDANPTPPNPVRPSASTMAAPTTPPTSVAPSQSTPALFKPRGPQASFASLAASQEPAFQIQVPSTSASSQDLQGRETDRSRSWRRGCEKRAAIEAGNATDPAIVASPDRYTNHTPVVETSVTEAMAKIEIIESTESRRRRLMEASVRRRTQAEKDKEDRAQESPEEKKNPKEPSPPGEEE